MRLATWNVNGVRARLDFIRHWLDAREPDIVGVQELKVEDEGLPVDELGAAGYEVVAHCERGWNGVGILSRRPPTEITRGLPGVDDLGARFISAEYDGLTFMTAYVPNGKTVTHPDFIMKLDWLDALGRHIHANCTKDDPIVLCGDFNLVPAAIDSWDEERLRGSIFHTDQERQRFKGLLDWGFYDVFRESHPTAVQFSWWDYRAGAFHKGHGLRIDFVLATRPVMERVTNVEIDRLYRKKKEGLTASDHAPVIVDVDGWGPT